MVATILPAPAPPPPPPNLHLHLHYLHPYLCMLALKHLASLCITCTDWPWPSRLIDIIGTEISCSDPYIIGLQVMF